MSVHTKLLAVGNIQVAGSQYVYTTPALHTSILKDIRVISYGGAAQTLEIILSATSGHQVRIWRGPMVQYEPQGASCWCVIPEGYGLLVNVTANGDVQYWMSGTELEGVPAIPTSPTFRENLDETS